MLEINYPFFNPCLDNWEDCWVEFYAQVMSENSIGAAATAMLLNGMDAPKTDKAGREGEGCVKMHALHGGRE